MMDLEAHFLSSGAVVCIASQFKFFYFVLCVMLKGIRSESKVKEKDE